MFPLSLSCLVSFYAFFLSFFFLMFFLHKISLTLIRDFDNKNNTNNKNKLNITPISFLNNIIGNNYTIHCTSKNKSMKYNIKTNNKCIKTYVNIECKCTYCINE